MREREREEEGGSRRAEEGDTRPGPEPGFLGPDREMALVHVINENGLNGWVCPQRFQSEAARLGLS